MKTILAVLLFCGVANANQYLNYNFGTVMVNTFNTQRFIYTNGPFPTIIRQMSISGLDFSLRSNCPQVLPPNFQCLVDITYWPMFTGFSNGRANVYMSDINDNVIIYLYGNAIGYGEL